MGVVRSLPNLRHQHLLTKSAPLPPCCPQQSNSFSSHPHWAWFASLRYRRCQESSGSVKTTPQLCRAIQRVMLTLTRFWRTLQQCCLKMGSTLQLSLTQTLDSATPFWGSPSMDQPICSTGGSGDCQQSTEPETQVSLWTAPRFGSQPTLESRLPLPTMMPQQSSWASGCQLGSRQILQTLEYISTLRWMLQTVEDCS